LGDIASQDLRAPYAGKMLGIGIGGQEMIDPLPTFIGVGVVQEITMIGERGNAAHEVQVEAAEVSRVIRTRRRREARFFLLDGDKSINGTAQGKDFLFVRLLAAAPRGRENRAGDTQKPDTPKSRCHGPGPFWEWEE